MLLRNSYVAEAVDEVRYLAAGKATQRYRINGSQVFSLQRVNLIPRSQFFPQNGISGSDHPQELDHRSEVCKKMG